MMNSVLNKNIVKNLTFIFCIVLLSYSSHLFAKHAHTHSPDKIKGTQKITAEILIQHVENIPGLVIIDSRIKTDRRLGYIEGSLSLPDNKTSCSTLSKILPQNKSAVIFYCNGPKCGRSAVAVKIAITCGYTNTYWFRGGIEEWKQKKYPIVTN